MIRVAENKRSPSEKEDEKVDHLINKKTPRSRKYKSRRGPKFDNRKRRITEDDKDLNIKTVEGDRDLSLNYKYSTEDILSFIAVRVAADLKPLMAAIKAYAKDLDSISRSIGDAFRSHAQSFYIEPAEDGSSGFKDDGLSDIQTRHTRFKQLRKDLSKYLAKADVAGIVQAVGSNWPNGDESDYGSRAAIIGALKKAIDSIPIPESLKIPFLRKNVKEFVNDKEFIQKILNSSRTKSSSKIDEKLIPRFAQLAAAYQMVSSNPNTVNASAMSNGIESLSENIMSQYEELNHLNAIMEDWHEVISSLRHEPQATAELGKSSKDYDDIISSIDTFFKGEKRLIDIGAYIDEMGEYAKKNYGGVPPDLSSLFPGAEYREPEVSFDDDVNPEGKSIDLSEIEEIEARMELEGEDLERVVQHYVDLLREAIQNQDTKEINKFLKELYRETQANLEEDIARIASQCVATSNEESVGRIMTSKTAAFHGLLDQKGNPVCPPNTGFKSYDKRFFGKDHYDSIIAVAKDYLKEGWLTSGWDQGASDAPLRAALDLAIHTADNCLYQSKIDVETYNLLLNKLGSWGYDTFSDTLLPFKKNEGTNRRASMRPEHQVILKIANDIRESHPEHSVAILKNLRALATEEGSPSIPEAVSSHEMPDVSEVANNPPEEFTFRSMGDEDFAQLRSEIESQLEKKFDGADIDAFLEGFDDLFENLQEKVAAFVPKNLLTLCTPSVSLASMIRVSSVTSDEHHRMAEVGRKYLAHISAQKNPADLLYSMSCLARSYQKFIGSRMAATIPLGELVRFAHSNPSVRPSLLPLLAQQRDAYLARTKKSKKKVSQKKDEKKPAKGEKAPPFQKKDEKPAKGDKEKKSKDSKGKGNPFVKKVSFDASDLNW